ncbi:translocation/assembly module TamB domain-containing protein [Caldimonas sp. KR1-144]|uniref:translocation/assembly module TamB domain-containing protein n=1 Tax=Caldimonas sp. KR1-144 TaxID=3400911 RepID=UPI003BFBD1B6
MSATTPPRASAPPPLSPRPPAPPPRAPAWRRLARALLIGVVLLVAAAAGGGWLAWRALHTEAGSAQALALAQRVVPGLALSGARGALLGESARFALDALSLDAAGWRVRVGGLRWQSLTVSDWQWHAPFVSVHAASLGAASVDLEPPRRTEGPASPPPTALHVPITARIDALHVQRLSIAGQPAPVEDLAARLEAGAVHRIDGLSLRWRGLALQGRATVGADAPMPLSLTLDARGEPAQASGAVVPPWARGAQASLRAGGTLARIDAQASLTLQGQQVDAQARVTPFEPLPVSQLEARFARLDLAPLAALLDAAAPTTALDGHLTLQLDATRPLALSAQLRNDAPGRWDLQRLPLRELNLQASGRGTRWSVERARLQLAGERGTAAGRIELRGSLDGATRVPLGELVVELADVVLPALDARAPPLRLAGPLTIKHQDPARDAPFGRVDLDARLTGGLVADAQRRAPPALREAKVRLRARAELTPQRLLVSALEANAGDAVLDGRGQARRDGASWRGDAQLQWKAFDPALWLPGDPGAAWRRAGNRIDGDAQLQARVPIERKGASLLAVLDGELNARIAEGSRFAGLPIAGQSGWRADGRGVLDGRLALRAADQSADAELHVAGRGADRLSLRVDAPQLERLAPLGEALALGPLAGRAQLGLEASGGLAPWLGLPAATPSAVQSRGNAELEGLRVGTLRVARSRGRWNLTLPGAAGSAAGAWQDTALQLDWRAERIELPSLVISAAAAQLQGRLADHHGGVRAVLRQPQPQAGAEARAPGAPLLLDATLAGQWLGEGEGQRWRLRLPRLSLQAVDAVTAQALVDTTLPADAGEAIAALPPLPPAGRGAPPPLLLARDLEMALERQPGSARATLAPGALALLGATLRWREARWEQAEGQPPRLDLAGEIEPFALAALLQRLQPDFGWQGDLRAAARFELRSRPEVSVRAEIARLDGDLTISEFGVETALGLSEARLAVVADGGRWHVEQRLSGANLGHVGGDLRIQADPRALFPGPDAPLDGSFGARVENLAGWGAWVPAGWRLGGRADAALHIGGTVAAPSWTGVVRGDSLALRNTLEGVALDEGRLELRFDGETARLETLAFKAGNGTLRASGDARLGAQPVARLQLAAERATVLGRVDRRAVVSGELAIRLEAQAIDVRGRLQADEGLVDISRADAPSLGDDVVVRRAGDVEDAQAAAAARRSARPITLDVVANLGQRFRLRGRGIDTRLEGELRLTTPRGRLAANGEIRTERGTYEAYGQKLEIERGVITFVGDIANPRLDIEAIRPNLDTRVGVRVGGSANAPRVRLFSDPELPATEKLALLVTGRSYDSLGGGQSLIMQRAAWALLAGEGNGDSEAFNVAKLLQLDELSVRQNEDGTVRETVVTVGKQISDRVYVGYERGLNATTGNWQITYRIAQRFTLRAQSGDDPALDLIWLFRWN